MSDLLTPMNYTYRNFLVLITKLSHYVDLKVPYIPLIWPASADRGPSATFSPPPIGEKDHVLIKGSAEAVRQ